MTEIMRGGETVISAPQDTVQMIFASRKMFCNGGTFYFKRGFFLPSWDLKKSGLAVLYRGGAFGRDSLRL